MVSRTGRRGFICAPLILYRDIRLLTRPRPMARNQIKWSFIRQRFISGDICEHVAVGYRPSKLGKERLILGSAEKSRCVEDDGAAALTREQTGERHRKVAA